MSGAPLPLAGPLAGRRCLVTGATGTLGTAICRRLYADGAHLLPAGRDAARLAALAEALRAEIPGGGPITPVVVDLAAPDAVARVADAVSAAGGLDALINNAAIQGPIGPLWENDWAEWEECIRLDLLVPVALCRALVGPLSGTDGKRGKIVNISGGGATGPRANFSAYGVAKAALVRFTETFAHEVKARGIDVNAIAPGVIASKMTQAILAAGGDRTGGNEVKAAEKAIGTDNAPTQDKAAALASWLSSAKSDGVSGRLLAALWDPWDKLDQVAEELAGSDIYTLRRITAAERGKDWETA